MRGVVVMKVENNSKNNVKKQKFFNYISIEYYIPHLHVLFYKLEESYETSSTVCVSVVSFLYL